MRVPRSTRMPGISVWRWRNGPSNAPRLSAARIELVQLGVEQVVGEERAAFWRGQRAGRVTFPHSGCLGAEQAISSTCRLNVSANCLFLDVSWANVDAFDISSKRVDDSGNHRHAF